MLGPLLIVVTISMLKDGYEDVKRSNQDNKINSQKAKVISQSSNKLSEVSNVEAGQALTVKTAHTRLCKWRDLNVGDCILLQSDEQVFNVTDTNHSNSNIESNITIYRYSYSVP